MIEADGTARSVDEMLAWGARPDDPRAIAVVGSHSRSDRPADRWSELGAILMVRRPRRLLAWPEWVGLECGSGGAAQRAVLVRAHAWAPSVAARVLPGR